MSVPQEQMQDQQASTVRQPKRWPLATNPHNRDYTISKDARLVNCYAELNKQLGTYEVEKRPGTGAVLYNIGFSASGNGMYLWQRGSAIGEVYAIFGSQLYKNGAAFGAPLSSPTTVEYFAQIPAGGATAKLMFADNNFGYFTDGTTLTKIVDANFPTALASGVIFLDGTFYVMDVNGNIKGSALNDPSTWPALNTIAANQEGDFGVYLARHFTYVVALKSYTCQVFQDAGNPTGSPLSPVPGAFSSYGCLDGNTVQQIDDVLLWVTISKGQSASPQIARMDDLTARIVSNPFVDRLLSGLITIGGGFRSVAMKIAGHRLYIFTCLNATFSLVYDLDQDLFYEWTDSTGTSFWPFVAFCPRTFPPSTLAGQMLVQHQINGTIAPIDADFIYPTDVPPASATGPPCPVDIYTPNYDGGSTRRKYLKAMYFKSDRVVGSKIICRFNDNDYAAGYWSNPREVDLSLVKPRLTDCGTFINRRAYHIHHQSPTPMRIRAIDLQMDFGTL